MFDAYHILPDDRLKPQGFWDARSVRKNWFMGERDIVGGFFEGLTDRSLNRGDPATLKRHLGYGFGQVGHWGYQGAKLGVQAGISGGIEMAKLGWHGIKPGSSARALRGAAHDLTSAQAPRMINGHLSSPIGGGQIDAAKARLGAAWEAHHGRPMTPGDLASVRSNYSMRLDPAGAHAAKAAAPMRSFLYRSGSEHMRKGWNNFLRHSVGSRLSWGLTGAFAIGMSDDNLLDPYKGVARMGAQLVGSEIGFHAGGAIGASIGTWLGGPIGSAIGYGVGVVAGVIAGGELFDIPFKLSEMGHKYGRQNAPFRARFQDSKEAATMRQRAVQAIHRSQMNARSAFGHEALSFHA